MDRAALHRASPNPPRGVSAARQGLNKVPSGHEYKSSARPKADRRHEKLNTMTTSQVSGSGPHTYNVSGLDRTNWKPDPRNAGRSSGRNDKSGSWHAQSDLPTTRESVDDMSDDDFKDMMKRYVTENFGSMVNKYVENFGSIKNCHSNKGSCLPPTGRSWTRPGWYLGAASLHPAPRGRRAGRPAGPGLPNGDETGDGD